MEADFGPGISLFAIFPSDSDEKYTRPPESAPWRRSSTTLQFNESDALAVRLVPRVNGPACSARRTHRPCISFDW